MSRFVATEARCPDAPKKPNGTSRRYAFTSFKDEEPSFDAEKMTYLIYQREVCPETQREHWQGFIILKSPSRFHAVKAHIGDSAAHLEECKGSDESNIAYCSKDDSCKPGCKVVEHGSRPKGKGARTDIEDAVRAIESGVRPHEYVSSNPRSLRFYAAMCRFSDAIAPTGSTYNGNKKVLWLSGPSGCGKTRLAHHLAGGSVVRLAQVDRNHYWFDGAAGQKVVLWDDVQPDNMPPLSAFKQIMDSYGFPCPVKGGFGFFNPDLIVVTSNYPLDAFYVSELNWKDGRLLEGPELAEARKVISRRIEYRDCWVNPPTELEFYLEHMSLNSDGAGPSNSQ